MINALSLIAKNTFRETIRDRILYSIIGFAILTIAVTLLAASVSLGQDERVIKSFGLTAILIFLLLITIFIGTQLVYREIERKTIYLTLTKPIDRETFFLGKFLGLCLTLAVSTLIMGTVFLILLWVKFHAVDPVTIWAIIFMLVESWLITAVGMLFGSFASPIASAVYTFSIVLIGHSSDSIWTISQKSQPFLKYSLETIYYLFPNLIKFNLRNEVIFHSTIQPTQILIMLAYFVGYTVMILLLGLSAFRRHEF